MTGFDLDEFHSLERVDRDALGELSRGTYAISDQRQTPKRFLPLLARGLAFQSHAGITITRKGEEVLERVA